MQTESWDEYQIGCYRDITFVCFIPDWSEEAQDSSDCEPVDDSGKKDIEKELLL
jgi:hypothetical protein